MKWPWLLSNWLRALESFNDMSGMHRLKAREMPIQFSFLPEAADTILEQDTHWPCAPSLLWKGNNNKKNPTTFPLMFFELFTGSHLEQEPPLWGRPSAQAALSGKKDHKKQVDFFINLVNKFHTVIMALILQSTSQTFSTLSGSADTS